MNVEEKCVALEEGSSEGLAKALHLIVSEAEGLCGVLENQPQPELRQRAARIASCATRVLEHVQASHAGEIPEGVPEDAKLSKRESQVLAFMADGYTAQQTADLLGVKKKTVDTYRTRLRTKLGLVGRVDLVRYAQAVGLAGTARDLVAKQQPAAATPEDYTASN